MRLCRKKIRRPKAKQKHNLATAIKDNLKKNVFINALATKGESRWGSPNTAAGIPAFPLENLYGQQTRDEVDALQLECKPGS